MLYLSVGKLVLGPTCVWEGGGGGGGHDDLGALTTVPARAGRLLRFDGRLMHAVPQPVDVWLEE